MKRLFLSILVFGFVLLNACSAPSPAMTPDVTDVAQMDNTSNQLVVEVDENGLLINKNRFAANSTLDDYIRVLGSPSRVTELMNTIHTYDDVGIMLYHPPHTNEITSVSIDFTNDDYAFSPKHAFSGKIVIGGSIVHSLSSLDSLKTIITLTVDDSSFGVHRAYLGDTILIFEYMESTSKLDGLAISFSEISGESTTTTEPTPTEEGWVRLKIDDVGSIDYPTDFLEVQSGDYKEFVGEGYEVLDLVKTDFTLQQVGLNELKTSALEEYRRVTLTTVHLNPGEEVFRANERYTMSQLELAVFQQVLLDQVEQENETLKSMGLGEIKVIDPGSVEVVEVSGMFPIVCTYKRQLNDNPVVLVRTYLFWNYDMIHYLVLSCRVVDEEECDDIYERILQSFRLD